MQYKPTSSNYDTFIQYRAVIIRAIALAWKDPAFKAELFKEPKSALKETFQYDFPYDMDVNVLDGSARWSPTSTVGWTVTAQNTVRLVLPPKPEAGEEAVALATYNAQHLTFLTNY
ncbi:MAG: hypothetical protein H7Z39_15495 [Burkholderiaceae bacterium]|nr:hypothetical protein [Burkholderiaceae bacterium]